MHMIYISAQQNQGKKALVENLLKGVKVMADIVSMIPWGAIVLAVIEYFLGKTNWVQANSTIELGQNLYKKIQDKNHVV